MKIVINNIIIMCHPQVQTMFSVSSPGHLYSVDVETTNADIPYADAFYVVSHFFLVKVIPSSTDIIVELVSQFCHSFDVG